MFTVPRLTALLFAITCSTAPSLAQSTETSKTGLAIGMFDASDPRGIQSVMRDAGYEASLTTDKSGNPVINARLSRSAYRIQFYECEQGEFCNSIQFLTEHPAPDQASLSTVNAFNVQWRYARASLVNQKVRLQMDVNLDAGVTSDNLRDTLDIWRQLLDIYEREILALS